MADPSGESLHSIASDSIRKALPYPSTNGYSNPGSQAHRLSIIGDVEAFEAARASSMLLMQRPSQEPPGDADPLPPPPCSPRRDSAARPRPRSALVRSGPIAPVSAATVARAPAHDVPQAVQDNRTAYTIATTRANRALCAAAAALRENMAHTAIGLTLAAMCAAALALSVLAYIAVQASKLGSEDPRATDDNQWPPGTTRSDVAPDADPGTLLGTGYSTKEGTTLFRVGFGSKYAASQPEARSVWHDAIRAAQVDAWIWAGNAAYFDRPVFDCGAAANAGRPECNCGSAGEPACTDVTMDKAASQSALLLASGYADFLDDMCGGYVTAQGAVPPGSNAQICPKPVLGIYGTHDSFGILSDRTFAQKLDVKQLHADLMGDKAAHSTLRGEFSRKRIYSDGAKGRSMDVYLLDEHFDRAPVPCNAVAAACAAHPDTARTNRLVAAAHHVVCECSAR